MNSDPEVEGPEPKRFEFSTGKMCVVLIVMYLLSPKILTTQTYYEKIYPTPDRIEIEEILSVQREASGDLEVCLAVADERRESQVQNRLILPIASETDLEKAYKAGSLEHELGRGTFNRVRIPSEAVALGCPDIRVLDVHVVNKRTDEFRAAMMPESPVQEELRLTDSGFIIVYVQPSPRLWVTFEATDIGPSQRAPIHHVYFDFQPPQRQIHWWNLWMMIPAILADSVTGPLGWLLFGASGH